MKPSSWPKFDNMILSSKITGMFLSVFLLNHIIKLSFLNFYNIISITSVFVSARIPSTTIPR